MKKEKKKTRLQTCTNVRTVEDIKVSGNIRNKNFKLPHLRNNTTLKNSLSIQCNITDNASRAKAYVSLM